MVFRQEIFYEYASLELFYYHYSLWVKRELGEAAPSIDDINRFPSIATSPPHQAPTQHNATWKPPPSGSIKVNIDGSFSRTSNHAGIGGIF